MVCSLLCQKDGIRRLGPGLYGLTPETRIGTNLQYLRAYLVAPELLRELTTPRMPPVTNNRRSVLPTRRGPLT